MHGDGRDRGILLHREITMAVSNVSSNVSSYLTNAQNPYQAVKTTYGQLQQNLTAGNMSGAQQVYSALVKAIQNSPIGQAGNDGTVAVQQSLITVGQALQSGNLGDVQLAFTALGKTINSAAQSAASPSSTAALTPAQLTAKLVNQIMSAGNGGSGGTDPLLAALNGSTGTGSMDPLLNALNGNDAANNATGTDPMISTPSTGVNIVV